MSRLLGIVTEQIRAELPVLDAKPEPEVVEPEVEADQLPEASRRRGRK